MRVVLVNKGCVLPISRVEGGGGGWSTEYCECGFLGGGVGGDLVVAGDTEASPSADFTAAEVEAVGADCLLPLADDLSEGGASLAFGPSADATVVAGLLELGEECAGAIGEFLAAAEVDGALAAGDSVGDAIVGSVAGGFAGAVACDDGADAGEDIRVVADEVEGRHGEGPGDRLQAAGDRFEGWSGFGGADIYMYMVTVYGFGG